MTNKVYDILKAIALIYLPALTTLYGVVATVLSIPFTDGVITIAIAVDTCLGTILGISTAQYNKK